MPAYNRNGKTYTPEELAAHLEDQANSRDLRDGYDWTVTWDAQGRRFVFNPNAPRIRLEMELEDEDVETA